MASPLLGTRTSSWLYRLQPLSRAWTAKVRAVDFQKAFKDPYFCIFAANLMHLCFTASFYLSRSNRTHDGIDDDTEKGFDDGTDDVGFQPVGRKIYWKSGYNVSSSNSEKARKSLLNSECVVIKLSAMDQSGSSTQCSRGLHPSETFHCVPTGSAKPVRKWETKHPPTWLSSAHPVEVIDPHYFYERQCEICFLTNLNSISLDDGIESGTKRYNDMYE